MAEIDRKEPQSAADYDDRTRHAVKSVLIEIGQILGSYRGKFAVVGGAVPWLLLDEALRNWGHEQREGLKRFQLMRQVPATDGGAPIDVIVDFLMPRDAKINKNRPPLIDNFAVQRAGGTELALNFYKLVAIDGAMPEGGKNRVEVAICSIPALLAMKGHALNGRDKKKDAYDIYYCVRNYAGGAEALAQECRPILEHASGEKGYRNIAEKFAALDG